MPNSTFAWFTTAFTPTAVDTDAVAVVSNNTNWASISLAMNTVENNTHALASYTGSSLDLLPATTDDGDSLASGAYALTALKTYVNIGTTSSKDLVVDGTSGYLALQMVVTMAYNASASASRKYGLGITIKSGASVDVWKIASYDTTSSKYTDISGFTAGTKKNVVDDIVQSTSADQTWTFLLYANGLEVTSTISAISDLVTFTLDLASA